MFLLTLWNYASMSNAFNPWRCQDLFNVCTDESLGKTNRLEETLSPGSSCMVPSKVTEIVISHFFCYRKYATCFFNKYRLLPSPKRQQRSRPGLQSWSRLIGKRIRYDVKDCIASSSFPRSTAEMRILPSLVWNALSSTMIFQHCNARWSFLSSDPAQVTSDNFARACLKCTGPSKSRCSEEESSNEKTVQDSKFLSSLCVPKEVLSYVF